MILLRLLAINPYGWPAKPAVRAYEISVNDCVIQYLKGDVGFAPVFV